jgi:hypothetical protein
MMSKNNRQNREKKKRKRLAKEDERRMREQRHPEDSGTTIEEVVQLARRVSNGRPLGWADHRPQPGAEFRNCYDNAREMARREGGDVVIGWSFHLRFKPGVGRYVFTTPHAVWLSPHDGTIADVTPYPNPHHAPVMKDGKVLFLGDKDSEPVFITDSAAISQPLRFFTLDDSPKLATYVAELNAQEVAKFEREKQEALARAQG